MQDVKDFIDMLGKGDKTSAKDLLGSILHSKALDRINSMKPYVAQKMFQKSQDEV